MKLKCIGGDCDGQITYCENYLKIGDLLRVRKPLKFEDGPLFEESVAAFRENRIPDGVVETYYLYRKACFNFSKDDIYYFAVDHNWTDKQALIYLFDKHNGT
jgi:hypothetical protein